MIDCMNVLYICIIVRFVSNSKQRHIRTVAQKLRIYIHKNIKEKKKQSFKMEKLPTLQLYPARA